MSFDLKLANNDLLLNSDGTPQTVRDNAKLAQDVLKAVLTERGENRFHKWYGNVIGVRSIGNVLENSQLETELERSVQDLLALIVALQREQARIQYVSPGETIAALRGVDALRSPTDPREWQVKIVLVTRELTPLEVTFGLRI